MATPDLFNVSGAIRQAQTQIRKQAQAEAEAVMTQAKESAAKQVAAVLNKGSTSAIVPVTQPVVQPVTNSSATNFLKYTLPFAIAGGIIAFFVFKR